MTDIHVFRKARLRQLISGKQVLLADAIGRQPDYVSALQSGKRNLGEKLAFKIEELLDLQRGWLGSGVTAPVTYQNADMNLLSFGARLKWARQEAKITQEELAALSSITQATICDARCHWWPLRRSGWPFFGSWRYSLRYSS